MAWTWAFSAAPVPTTAFLTSRGAYSPIASPRPRGGEKHDAARLAELQRRLRIFVEEHLLAGGFGRAMRVDHLAQRRLQPHQPRRQVLLRVGPHLAVGDMAQPVALGGDHPPAGAAQARIEADDDQPSFSNTASDIS